MSLRPAAQTVAADRWRLAIVGYAALAALCRPLTVPAAFAVLLAAAVIVAVGVLGERPAPRRPANPRAAVLQWSAVALAVVVWELVAFGWGNDAGHPTLSLLLDPLLDTYPGRFLGWLGWLSAARWLVTR